MKKEARTRLRAGFDEIGKAEKDFDGIKQAKLAAENAVGSAESELASFADLDGKITKFRIAATKKGANPKDLSNELKARVSARLEAVAELEQAKKTLDAIEDEYAAAERDLQAIRDGHIKLVLEVLQEMGQGFLDKLAALNAEREILTGLISGLAETNVRIDGRYHFFGRTRYGSAFVSLGEPDSFSPWPAGISAAQANAKRWEGIIATLMNDPDAEIRPPKPVKPSDLILGEMPPGGLVFARPFELKPEA